MPSRHSFLIYAFLRFVAILINSWLLHSCLDDIDLATIEKDGGKIALSRLRVAPMRPLFVQGAESYCTGCRTAPRNSLIPPPNWFQ